MARLKNKVWVMALSLLALGACEQADIEAPDQSYADDYLKLQYGECFGTCPVFDIQLFRSGKLIYIGKKHVKTTGTVMSELEPTVFADIEKLFEAYEGDGLTDPKECPIRAADLPKVLGEIKLQGETLKISHNYGCRGYAWRIAKEELIANIGQLLNVHDYDD